MASLPTELRPVDTAVWKAVAGNNIAVPVVNSTVYYFPQGHFEQSFLSSPSLSIPPMILSRVLSVNILANPETDEVFAKIKLLPYSPTHTHTQLLSGPENNENENNQMVTYTKVLTPSDANNGGGFSVPRDCANSVFPLLDLAAHPPVQNIDVKDVHGVSWKFRHIYRGTPHRHLLTTGWSKFVNHKKLVAGDSVVFMRNVGSGELAVGIRRGERWGEGEGRGGVTGESVVEAGKLAEKGLAFEVVYYPRVGFADFVVRADVVEESLNKFWLVGMNVRMMVESLDSSTMTWFTGTVSDVVLPDSGSQSRFPWKMLQVAWDEHEFLQHFKRVSPWQVEPIMPPSPPHSTQHPSKKSRITHRSQTDGVQDLPFPILGSSNSLMGNFNSSMMGYCSLPAGMQGARHSQLFGTNSSDLIDKNTDPICGWNSFGKNMPTKLQNLSTELNMSQHSEILSPDSQSNAYRFGIDTVGKQNSVSSKKAGLSSIKLFGKMIHVQEGAESNSDDTVSAEGNETTMIEEAESVKKSSSFFIAGPERNLIDGIDSQI